jgi:MFS family permease
MRPRPVRDRLALRGRHQNVFYGWWIVVAWAVLNICWSGTLVYGLTVFFAPVRHSFGWNATLMASLFGLPNLLAGLLPPLNGVIFDRVGPRPIMLVASLCAGIGLIAVSRTNSLPSFVIAFVLVSVGYGMWSGTGLATAGLWFSRSRGLAMGIIVAGSSAGGILVPIWQSVVDSAGWRDAFLAAGAMMLSVSLAVSLLLRHRPADLGLLPDGDPPEQPSVDPLLLVAQSGVGAGSRRPSAKLSGVGVRAALATWQFWLISGVTTLILAGSTAATILLLPRLEAAQVRPSTAVTAATVAVLLGIVGRPSIGLLADRRPVTVVAAWLFVLQALGLLAFGLAPGQWPLLVIFVISFGLSNDSIRVLASLLLLRYFGAAAYGRILGLHFAVVLLGRVLGPIIAGALHDGGYGYGMAFVVFALLSVAMIVPVLRLRPPFAASIGEASAAGL